MRWVPLTTIFWTGGLGRGRLRHVHRRRRMERLGRGRDRNEGKHGHRQRNAPGAGGKEGEQVHPAVSVFPPADLGKAADACSTSKKVQSDEIIPGRE